MDECQVNNGGCAMTCENTVGSYSCSCGQGLELDQDQRSCKGKLSKKCIFCPLRELHSRKQQWNQTAMLHLAHNSGTKNDFESGNYTFLTCWMAVLSCFKAIFKYQEVKNFTSVTRWIVYARLDWTNTRWDLTHAMSEWRLESSEKKFKILVFSVFEVLHLKWVKSHLT